MNAGMDHCLTCGGAIFPPNTAVSYSGKFCNCYVMPKIQQPAREIASESELMFLQRLVNKSQKELKDLQGLVRQLKTENAGLRRLVLRGHGKSKLKEYISD